jgi:predicted  nucleic acid-binding Zn-ribbon protein
MWRCGTCGYVWDGEEPPEHCQNCGAAKFSALPAKAADEIDRARFANSLLMQLSLLMDQVMDLAEDGIDDNLDRNCSRIFEKALAEAEVLQQSIKAELQAHMQKGKWG